MPVTKGSLHPIQNRNAGMFAYEIGVNKEEAPWKVPIKNSRYHTKDGTHPIWLFQNS
ncbi:hypothetical protein NCCP133_02380 [Cytobacillus sp. NCCP-133]|nr:hypothetical protein NCCP133_02380 [Cytobacillus sp. NCCP-133]